MVHVRFFGWGDRSFTYVNRHSVLSWEEGVAKGGGGRAAGLLALQASGKAGRNAKLENAKKEAKRALAARPSPPLPPPPWWKVQRYECTDLVDPDGALAAAELERKAEEERAAARAAAESKAAAAAQEAAEKAAAAAAAMPRESRRRRVPTSRYADEEAADADAESESEDEQAAEPEPAVAAAKAAADAAAAAPILEPLPPYEALEERLCMQLAEERGGLCRITAQARWAEWLAQMQEWRGSAPKPGALLGGELAEEDAARTPKKRKLGAADGARGGTPTKRKIALGVPRVKGERASSRGDKNAKLIELPPAVGWYGEKITKEVQVQGAGDDDGEGLKSFFKTTKRK